MRASIDHPIRLATPGAATASVTIALALMVCATAVHAEEGGSATVDGLVPVDSSRVAMAYIDPEADFSVFQRVAILDPYVAFRSNWQRDQNRTRRRNIRSSDMERIRRDVASLFKQVFTERLEAGGFQVVEDAAYDVLVLRPAIIDLDITAPDVRSGGRSQTFAASSGAATLLLELFDSVTGDIIGRAVDRQAVRQAGSQLSFTNTVTNTAEGRRMFRRWADTLLNFLNQHYR